MGDLKINDLIIYKQNILYWSFALASASGFYVGTRWIGSHFKPEFKKELGEWLNGYYESTWASQFCRLFDMVFGAHHFSIKRIISSIIASSLAVILLYVLFAHVLGILGSRTFGSINLIQALLLGMIINFLPDYLSLIETRWLLSRFSKVQSVLGQLILLITDLIFTAGIIFFAIYVYSYVFVQSQFPSLIEIVALFSIYSVFFYSTFLSSIWAWIYCLSSWFIRFFTHLGLRNVLNIREEPVKQIALVGSAFVLLGGIILGPIFKSSQPDKASAFDDFICRMDLKACFHAARSADNQTLIVHFMELACRSDILVGHCGSRLEKLFDFDLNLTSSIWRDACDGGYARGCNALGYIYATGRGLEEDDLKAIELYERACNDGDMDGCRNLGWMYANGNGVAEDDLKAVKLFQQACNDGHMLGCYSVGRMYETGQGVIKNTKRAAALYQQSCDGRYLAGCRHLGWMYANGVGVNEDDAKAFALYQQACEDGDMHSCNSLGRMYENGEGVDKNNKKASELYQKACDSGEIRICKLIE